jgi:hypothetical protein
VYFVKSAFLVSILFLIYCNNDRNKAEYNEANDSIVNGELRENTSADINAITKIDRIRLWRDSTRIITLPFRADFDTTRAGAFRVKFWEKDSIFRKDFKRVGDIYLMGLLADTANFYTIAFMAVAAFGNPGLITFDKSGNKIDIEILTKENCVIYSGDVLLCKEYVTVESDLSLNYYYKSIVYGEGDSQDTVCRHSISRGKITEGGEIELGTLQHIDCKL